MSTQDTTPRSAEHPLILVTAATAPVGRALVEQLAAAGRPVRALTRTPQQADLPAGVAVVAGDLSDPASVEAALMGVDGAFLLAAVPGVAPAFIAAARRQGVRRIVFQSSGAIVDGAAEQPNAVAAFHQEIEQELRASGVEWTFLRLAVASAGGLFWAFDVAGQLERGDVVRGPYAQAAGAPIHPADFAAVARVALTEPGHAGQIYSLTGPRSLTHAEQIALLGAALGRALQYEELSLAEARAAMSPYAPAEVLLADWQQHLDQPAPVTDTVQRLTGRPPRSVEDWAASQAAGLR